MAWQSMMMILSLIFLGLELRSSKGLERKKFVVQPHPVQFNEEPHDWMVTQGASVSLTCNTTVVKVIGYINEDTTPLPQIRWFHNDVMINSTDHFTIYNHGIDTSTLTIRNVTSLEQGEYHCVVNEWVKPDGDWWVKTRSKSGYITVINSNSTLTVNLESHIMLSCVQPIALFPSSGVIWSKDGVEMSANIIDGNLILYEASENNSGHYQCIDPVDDSILLSYHVTVGRKENEFSQRPHLLTDGYEETHFITIMKYPVGSCIESPANQSVTLSCRANNYQEIRWYKNGELLEPSSEGTMYNQISGEFVIRREDACELLGVYQCFASNDIDTVHVSTRVLPFGWPNHPGRPELISHNSHSHGFTLDIRLHRPDYLGGLTAEDGLQYDIYFVYAGNEDTNARIHTENVDASNASTVISIELDSEVLITGASSIWSVYYFTAQIKVSNRTLTGIAAFPEGSPSLKVDMWCDLIDFPLPAVEETCYYNSTSDLVVHNITWYLKATQGGVTFRNSDIKNLLWYISGGCNYSNGTSVETPYVNQRVDVGHTAWNLPRDATCRVYIYYDTSCGSRTSYNQPCNVTGLENDAPRIGENEGLENDAPRIGGNGGNEGGDSLTVIIAVTIIPLVVAIIFIITSCFCYRKYLRRKASAMKMLENAEKLKKLQMSCPITDDQRSVITTQTASDLYIEKVNKWMEKLDDITEIDTNSVFNFDEAEMLDQIVNGRVVCADATPSHYIDYKTLRCNNNKIPTVSLSPASTVSRYFTRRGILPSIATADSGVESSAEVEGNTHYIESSSDMLRLPHHPTRTTKLHSTTSNHNLHDSSDRKTPEYDKLNISNDKELERPTVSIETDSLCNNQANHALKSLDDYIALANSPPRATERVDSQVIVEMTSQEDCVVKATERFGEYIVSDQSRHDQHVACEELLDEIYSADEVMGGSHDTDEEPYYSDNGYITSSMLSNIRNDTGMTTA